MGADRRTDVCDGGSDSDFNTRVALLCEFALEEFIEFGVEDSVGHELAALADGALLGSHGCSDVGYCVEEGREIPGVHCLQIMAVVRTSAVELAGYSCQDLFLCESQSGASSEMAPIRMWLTRQDQPVENTTFKMAVLTGTKLLLWSATEDGS